MSYPFEDYPLGQSLFTSDPDVMGGRLVFRGTRIPVEVLFENLADGMSLHDISDAYPGLSYEIAIATIELTSSTVREIYRT